MKRRMILGIAVLAMALLAAACGGGGKANESEFSAEPVDGGKSVKITGYTGTQWEVKIPSKIRKLPVTHIGDSAFRGKSLTSVTIPNTVTEIGQNAFSDNQLTKVTIPSSVTEIGSFAFYNNQLTSVTIPNSVTEIVANAFQKNMLTSVTIPNSVTRIGPSAFRDNPLTSISIPSSVTEIGEWQGPDGAAFPNLPNNILVDVTGTSAFGKYEYKPGNYVYRDGKWSVK